MKALIDTGPWVALIDRSEERHNACAKWFRDYSGVLFSTEAVLTEVLYLLNFSVNAQTAALDFVIKSAIQIIPSSTDSLKKTKTLMEKYSDLPMDYADATLVCLAMETGIRNIATFDEHFSVYRAYKTQPFVLLQAGC